MSEALAIIDDLTGGVLSAVVPFYQELADIALQTEIILGEVMEAIFNFFGVVDENVIGVDVITTKIIQDKNMYSNMMTRMALGHQAQPDGSVISKWMNATRQIETSYGGYQKYGESNYYRGLPSTSIKTSYVKPADVVDSVSTSVGQTVVVDSAIAEAPNKNSWTEYQLQSSNGFTPNTRELTIGTYIYKLDYIEYNYTTDVYDANCYIREDVTVDTADTTTITITNIDATTDNKNTVVTQQIVKTGVTTGAVISDVTTEISNIDEVIAIDTEIDSVTSTLTTTTELSVITFRDIVSVPSFVPVRYIIVKYYVTDATDWYWWMYELGSNTDTALENTTTLAGQMKFMSIVPIRSNKVSITADKTTDAYKGTKDLLELLAMDVDQVVAGIEESPDIGNVQDAFVQLSVNLNDSTPVIDKLMYDTFSELYENSGLISTDGARGYAAISENPYNLSLTWAGMYKKVVSGNIGDVGTYFKSTNTTRTEEELGTDGLIIGTKDYTQLVVRKQLTATYYAEYIMEDLVATTMIDATATDGSVLTSTKIQGIASGIEIPLAFFTINQLNTKELADLFPDVLKISIYAASIELIPWYQTSAFGDVLQVIAIIVTIVVTIFTFGIGSGIGPLLTAIIQALVINFVIGAIIGIVLEALLSMVDDPVLKAVLLTVAVVVIAYFGGNGIDSVLSADTVTTLVTGYADITADYFEGKTQELDAEYGKLEDRVKAFEEEVEDYENSLSELSTEYVAFLQSVDAQMYIAKGEIMYNFDNLFSYDIMVTDFYDNKLQLGAV